MRQLMRLLRYAYPYSLHIFGSVLLMAVVGLLEAFRVLLVGPVFDKVLNPATTGAHLTLFNVPRLGLSLDLRQIIPSYFHNAWVVVAVALVGSTVLKGVCDYIGTYLVNYGGFAMITDLRNDLYGSILRRPVAFFQRYATGTLLSTIVNDVEKVQFTLSTVLAEFLQQFFTLIFMVAAVILLGGRLSWLLLAFVPFIVASVRRIGRRVRVTTRGGQEKLADVQNILHETITGNRIVKAFSMEWWELKRFRDAAARLFRANLRVVRATALSSPLMDIFAAIAIAGMLWLGRNQIREQRMTAGIFLAFIAALFKLYEPVRKFAGFYNNFQQALGASFKVFETLDQQDEIRERPAAPALPPFRDSIVFDDVSFDYGEGAEEAVLQHVNLEVHAGEVLAIVGSSGAGKSTLVNLLPRFFDVTEGRLLVDGMDVRDVTKASLRAQIGIVTQETILFNDTIRNNIAYGQPKVSQGLVDEAARAAMAHIFIEKLPDGYNTMIGERGVRLSGGERQRLAIARALLKNAPILILDEATSALDSENEALVQAALQNLMAGRTVFVIAHRLSTVRHAHRIVVLEGGTIADVGRHEDLMNRLGTYRRLYELQFLEIDAHKSPGSANGTTNGNGGTESAVATSASQERR
jgi:subfamily B ATP-binding cassette protein MsbA